MTKTAKKQADKQNTLLKFGKLRFNLTIYLFVCIENRVLVVVIFMLRVCYIMRR
jgi:hypothetical protein